MVWEDSPQNNLYFNKQHSEDPKDMNFMIILKKKISTIREEKKNSKDRFSLKNMK